MSHPESVGWWSGGSLSCGPPGIVSTVRVSVMLRLRSSVEGRRCRLLVWCLARLAARSFYS